jgi:ABC-type phosphate/phosphonate transport system substrate-binding protein
MTSANLIACSRMYNLTPQIRDLWDDFFRWLSKSSGIGLDIVEHAAPAPMSQLWERPDMGAVFMCGFPFSQFPAENRPAILAVPVVKAAWAGGRPDYASHIVVAENGSLKTAADLSVAHWGWTVRDSQSGYHAARTFLAGILDDGASRPRTVGSLLNPSGIIAALHDGRIDAGAIDAYSYALLSMHAPDRIAGLRIIATTKSVPFPPLVASRAVPEGTVRALRVALTEAHRTEAGRSALTSLAIERFERREAADYQCLRQQAEETDRVLASPW